MQLDRLLQTQGFGTRSNCRSLIREGRVRVNDKICTDIESDVLCESLIFSVDDIQWQYRHRVYLMLHKPTLYECSHRPSHYPSVYSLLPAPLIARGVQAVGRLDADTTGLLLFSDDGQFIHTFTAPRKHIEKCYEVRTRYPVSSSLVERLLSGVILHDDPEPILATACNAIDDYRLRMTITEGKYHLVKRMIAAGGNRVEQLDRISIGKLVIPATLAPGHWQWLDDAQLDSLGWVPPAVG